VVHQFILTFSKGTPSSACSSQRSVKAAVQSLVQSIHLLLYMYLLMFCSSVTCSSAEIPVHDIY
jgi:hypothetical protein